MPIKIPNKLPAAKILEKENIFFMTETRAMTQDIRPLQILLLNLMPIKIDTETQFARVLGNTPLQIDLTLIAPTGHTSKNTTQEHMLAFYKTFNDIKDNYYDGLIITGAPIEHLDFEQVDYWEELCQIMAWSTTHVFSTLHICWGAQAGLYHHYGIPKYDMEYKLSGIFQHRVLNPNHPLMRGFDDRFVLPHSRYTGVHRDEIYRHPELEILASSRMAGVSVVCSKDGRKFFIMGHGEYDRNTLATEYFRDLNKGLHPDIPYNYFPENDPQATPPLTWRSNATLLFTNWLNYYVYQQTPYDLEDLKKMFE